MLIEKDSRSVELIKPIYEGKDLQKWHNPILPKCLICTHNGYDDILPVDIEQYPIIKEYLQNFEPKLSSRYDKGNTPYNLRNCAYQALFYGKKIVWGNLQNSNKFAWEDTGSVISAPACMLPVENKALLAVLNSKIVWLFLTSICVVRNGGYIEVKPQYFEQIPIPQLNNKSTELEKLADKMLSLNAELNDKKSRFIRRLQQNFANIKIKGGLTQFWQLSFADFVNELKKQKIKLTLAEQDEWEDYFTQYQNHCTALQQTISQTDKTIDQMVYQLYGLTDEEIKIVEQA